MTYPDAKLVEVVLDFLHTTTTSTLRFLKVLAQSFPASLSLKPFSMLFLPYLTPHLTVWVFTKDAIGFSPAPSSDLLSFVHYGSEIFGGRSGKKIFTY